MIDSTGHGNLLNNGHDYFFNNGPEYLDDMAASRAVFSLYQSYPDNTVQGAGCLVADDNGIPGKYWTIFQPAQVYQNPIAILSDIFGGGTNAGTIGTQSLIDYAGGAY